MLLRNAAAATLLLALIAPTAGAQGRRGAVHGGDTASPIKPIASVKDVMEAITIPSSDALFKAAADAPTSDAEWTAVRRQALILAESANLLLIAGRAPDRAAWTGFAVAHRDAAAAALKAAQAKDADALSTASDALYETCTNCHKQYLPK